MTFGSRETATMLFNHYNGDPDLALERRAPKGFRRIGDGAYRTAILDKANNIVYKIGDYDSNVSESWNSRRLRRRSTARLPFELYIPRTRTYRMKGVQNPWGAKWPQCVSVQEYAQGARPTICAKSRYDYGFERACTCRRPICHSEVANIIADFTELDDLHFNNVLIDRFNVYWLIDIAQ